MNCSNTSGFFLCTSPSLFFRTLSSFLPSEWKFSLVTLHLGSSYSLKKQNAREGKPEMDVVHLLAHSHMPATASNTTLVSYVSGRGHTLRPSSAFLDTIAGNCIGNGVVGIQTGTPIWDAGIADSGLICSVTTLALSLALYQDSCDTYSPPLPFLTGSC